MTLVVITGLSMVVTALLVRGATVTQARERLAGEAQRVSAHIDSQRYEGLIPEGGAVLRIQIVARDSGEVLASSSALQGQAQLTGERPGPGRSRVDTTVCGAVADVNEQPCLLVVGYSVPDTAYGDVMVFTALGMPTILATRTLETVLFGMSCALLLAAGVVVWYGVGRALRPVGEISAQLDALSARDLHCRVPVPNSQDEIAHLARTANDSLERLEEAVGRQRRFVSDASHELRNPIAGMRTRLEVELADPHPDAHDREVLLDALLADTERLENIVFDLLELARLDRDVAEEREPTDMSVLVEEEFAHRRHSVPIHIRSHGPAWVTGSRVRLARLLTNLVANAERHARSRIEVVVGRRGDTVVLEVHDDGRGVAEADRERIFERFARLDESMERDPRGSGLGLAISREIAEAKGGTLVAGRSDLLGGAVFILTLPVARHVNEGSRRRE